MNPGQRVTVIDAANLPCQPGDTGTIAQVRHTARDFPIGVMLDDAGHVDWFRESELEPMETDNEG